MDLFSWTGSGDQDVEALLEEAEYLSRVYHQHEEALSLVDRARRSAVRRGATLPARCHMQKAAILKRQEREEEAAWQYHEALMMLSGTRDKATLAACVEGLAGCQLVLGRGEEARASLMQALDLSLEVNDSRAEERLRRRLGQLAEDKHHPREARAWYAGALKLAREGQNWAGVIADLDHLIQLATSLDRPHDREAVEEERRRLLNEFGELAYVGASAAPRSEVIARARDILYAERQTIASIPVAAPSSTIADDLYRQATALRKSGRHQEALPLYLSALPGIEAWNQPGNLSACLNGLGLCYRGLAKEALGQELAVVDQAELLAGSFSSLLTISYRLLHGQARGLAEKARTCHLWALEIHKEVGNLAGQASQISNLALIEELLGNLDSARRYQRWAVQAHRTVGKMADAAIDMINLARVEEELGDAEAAAAWRHQEQEITHAT